MARPPKQGLDYFPLDTELDDNVNCIEDFFGLTGFAVIIKLYQLIYRNGYYYRWADEELMRFSAKWNVEKDTLKNIIAMAVEKNIFNKKLFAKYFILTSNGIQKRFYEIIKKRTDVIIEKPFICNDKLMFYFRQKNPSETRRKRDGNATETGEIKKEKEIEIEIEIETVKKQAIAKETRAGENALYSDDLKKICETVYHHTRRTVPPAYYDVLKAFYENGMPLICFDYAAEQAGVKSTHSPFRYMETILQHLQDENIKTVDDLRKYANTRASPPAARTREHAPDPTSKKFTEVTNAGD